MKKIHPPRPSGISKKSDAPFWKGERAEVLVQQRAEQREAERAKKKKGRSRKSAGSPRQRTKEQQLRRLERALLRRKTVAAQVRIKQRIRELKRS